MYEQVFYHLSRGPTYFFFFASVQNFRLNEIITKFRLPYLGRIGEQFHEPEVISSCKQLLVATQARRVHISDVTIRWPDSLQYNRECSCQLEAITLLLAQLKRRFYWRDFFSQPHTRVIEIFSVTCVSVPLRMRTFHDFFKLVDVYHPHFFV